MSLIDQIAQRTEMVGDCAVWLGARDSSGYSSIYDGARVRVGHRLVYELVKGAIPSGMTVDHLCFVTAFLNPAHLRLLSNGDNARRQRSTLKEQCKNGHEFTAENTYLRTKNGRRQCRACNREAVARYRAKRGAA